MQNQQSISNGGQNKSDNSMSVLHVLFQIMRVPANVNNLKHEFSPDRDFEELSLIRAIKSLGLRARAINTSIDRFDRITFPAIGIDKQGKFFLIAKYDSEKKTTLVFDTELRKPVALDAEKMQELWSGRLMLITKRHKVFDLDRPFGLSWFVPIILKFKRLYVEVLVASFFIQLFALVTPVFFQVIMDKVLVHHSMSTLDVLMAGLVTISVFDTIVGGLRSYVFSHTSSRVDVILSAKVFNHLLRLPQAYFSSRRVGDSVARVRELESIRNFLTSSALTLVIDFFFTFVFLIVMYMYSPVLFWVVLATLPLYALLSIIITPILRKRIEDKFQRGAENQSFLVESITGIETIKAMAVEPQMQRKWEDQLAGYVRSSFKSVNLNNIASQVAQLINKLTTALILFIGAKLVMSGDITIGQLVAFNMLAGRVSSPVLRLSQLWQDFQQARISVDRLGDILNTNTEPKPSATRSDMPVIKGDISFEHVSFRYRLDGSAILSDVNLSINSGQIIGIVGSSGSGKSTLTKLIQRLYTPESGRVLVDGVDLNLVDPVWLRRQMGVVLQENILFNRSVKENIALSNPAMPMERVIEAAKLAGAHEFILELPEAYDTIIGERGASLSGGQRQRIAIARALINNPRILIFDEATSALDYESESIIQQNMKRICEGRTVIIIAHRLAAVRQCDRIITIEKGRVLEDGKHDDLVKSNGRYATLYAMQNGKAGDKNV